MTNDELAATLETLVARAAVLNGTKWKGTWLKTTTYESRDLVYHSGKNYMSLVDSNTNNNPATKPTRWADLSVYPAQITGGAEGTVTPTPDAVPQSDSEGQLASGWLPTPLSLVELYVAPDGDDSNTGVDWYNAKRTIYEGLQALRLAGGGTLYVAGNSEIGGPVPGQGIWLRSDFLPNSQYYFDVPGFISLDAPMNIVGVGNNLNASPFAAAPLATIVGADRTQFKPGIWIVGAPSGQALTITGLQTPFQGSKLGCRLWVDYDRELNGDIKQIDVTHAVRTGTSTVLTVDIASVTPITVTRAGRTGNVTTLTMPNPGYPFTPWHPGMKVLFTSGDGDFSSGEKEITDMSNFENSNLTWTISYEETAANVPEKDIAASSLQSHGCSDGELLWLSSNNSEFHEQQYYVTSHTNDSITVEDNFGSGDADEVNIGSVAHQERFYTRSTNVKFEACEFSLSSGLQQEQATHGMDIGSSLAAWLEVIDVATSGAMVWDSPLYNDPRCFEGLYAYGGGDARSGVAMRLYGCTSQNGGFFLEAAGAESALDSRDCLTEQNDGASTLPGMRVWGNGGCSVYIDRFENADGLGAATTPAVEIIGCPDYAPQVYRSGNVAGLVVGSDNWDNPSFWGPQAGYPTPWEGGPWGGGLQCTFFANGQLAARHHGAQRAMGVYNARFKNIVLDVADWGGDTGGQTYTAGQRAPDGSDTAIKIDSTAQFVNIFPLAVDGNTWEVGGKLVLSGWVNVTTLNGWQTELWRVISVGVEFEGGSAGVVTAPPPHYLNGWQFVSTTLTVESVSDPTPQIQIMLFFANGADAYVWGLNAHYVPLTDAGSVDVTSSDAAEYVGLMRQQPRYLEPGCSGTMDGTKFVAHGGLGIDSTITKVVGAGSGELTLTGSGTVYEPRYGEDGTTIIGWVALLQATVNP